MKIVLGILSVLLLLQCASGSVKSKGKKVPYQLLVPNIRVEKYSKTFNMKGEGPVRTNCPENSCTQADIKKMSEYDIKSFKKDGIWKVYKQKIEEETKKKYSVLDGKGEYRNDSREGSWEFYHESGELLRQTNYKNGIKEGIEKKFSKKGQQTEETTYSGEKKNGLSWKKNNKGDLLRQGNYSNGKKSGLWTEYYGKSGDPKKSEENYHNGKKNGKAVKFQKDGETVSAEGNYTNDLKSGSWKYYYPDGKLQSEGGYQPRLAPGEKPKEGEEPKSFRSGLWKEYYRSGEIFASGNRNHTRTGKWSFYYKNGNPRFVGVMANEMMMKRAKVYKESGEIEGDGELIISFVNIDENDNLKAKYRPGSPFTYYKNGVKYLEVGGEDKNGNTIAKLYESGRMVGKGPVVTGTTKKHGCWIMNGKKAYFMMDRLKTGRIAEMQGCK